MTLVYFAMMQTGHDEPPVKIGSSSHVFERMRELAGPFPVKLIGTVPNVIDPLTGRSLEVRIHEHLERYRLSGEWFRGSKRVFNTIENIVRRSNGGSEGDENADVQRSDKTQTLHDGEDRSC